MTCDVNGPEPVTGENQRALLDLPAGVPPLASLYLYVTDACNLRCRHCWISPMYDPGARRGHFLKPQYLEKAIAETLPLGLSSVKLTGGEPFLHPQIRQLLSIIDGNGLKINIEANGTLIDPDLAGFLRSLDCFAFISVSVDGLDARTHDWFRGVEGCFEKAVAGIRNLVENNISPQMICTLHRHNAGQMEDMVDMASSLGCSSIKFNHIQPVGRGKGQDELSLPVEEVLRLHTRIEKWRLENNGFSVCFDMPYAFKSIRNLTREPLGRCNIKNILGILADGRVSICGIGEAVPELIFGHAQSDSFRDIWLNHPILQEMREEIPTNLEGICEQCVHRNFCQGYCIAHSFYRSKRLNSSFWFCECAKAMEQFPENRLKNHHSTNQAMD